MGLSSNSISIYSDGINNLFDSLSGLVNVVCFTVMMKKRNLSSPGANAKTEQLLSFVLSVLVGITGVVFLYNSLERMMYPTPVWYQVSFLYILPATALVKLVLFIFLLFQSKKLSSDIVKIIAYDSLLDFFITVVTVITLFVSAKGVYAVDSLCATGISILILVSAVKMVTVSLRKLLNIPEKEKRDAVEEILLSYGISEDNGELHFSLGDKNEVYLITDKQGAEENKEEIKRQIFEKTGLLFYIAN